MPKSTTKQAIYDIKHSVSGNALTHTVLKADQTKRYRFVQSSSIQQVRPSTRYSSYHNGPYILVKSTNRLILDSDIIDQGGYINKLV